MNFQSKIAFFPEHELACKCCGLVKLDINFAVHLPLLRLKWGKPLTPSSVCRCPTHNTNESGHERSLHLTENPTHPSDGTMAADIIWRMWPLDEKLAFARMAWRMGWAVGLHDGFCHVDRRADIGLKQKVFQYGTWSGAFEPAAVMLDDEDE